MLKLENLVELALFADTVKDVISYEYEADAEGGYDVKVADGQIKECVKILAELMDKLNIRQILLIIYILFYILFFIKHKAHIQ